MHACMCDVIGSATLYDAYALDSDSGDHVAEIPAQHHDFELCIRYVARTATSGQAATVTSKCNMILVVTIRLSQLHIAGNRSL